MRLCALGILIVIAGLPAGAQSPQAQSEAAKSSLVVGRVVGEQGDGVRGARVAAGEVVVLSDGEGRFELTTPLLSLHVTKAGYAPLDLPVTAGRPLTIQLSRGATISGHVVDSLGDPVRGFVLLRGTNAGTEHSLGTDDRGEYRFGGLTPGTYTISTVGIPALSPQGRTETETRTIEVGRGEEQTVDLTATVPKSSSPPSATPLRTGSAVLRGRVVSTNGRSVPHALVTTRVGQTYVWVNSDADGAFEFRGITPGKYQMVAQRPGYRFVGGRAEVEVANGASGEAELILDPEGIISGIVTDQWGEPVQSVLVSVVRAELRSGRRELMPIESRTDDRGEYRIFGLPSGQYAITAAIEPSSPNTLPGYTRTYYPGTDDAAAARFVTVDGGAEIDGVTFELSRGRATRIRGQILDASGKPAVGGRVDLTPRHGAAPLVPFNMAATMSASGLFEFSGVLPGEYVIQADRGRQNASAEGEFGALPVTVDGRDVSDLVLQMSAGTTVHGQLTIHAADGTEAPPPTAFEVEALPADVDLVTPQWASAKSRSDGRFEMSGLNGPRRIHILHQPEGWIVESVVVDGVDASDAPVVFGKGSSDVEVAVTNRAAHVVGSVVDNQRPVARAEVLVFPTDRDRRYPRSRYLARVLTQGDGSFTLNALPPGTYYAIARPATVPYGVADALRDPQLLEVLEPLADSLTLPDFGDVALKLRLARP